MQLPDWIETECQPNSNHPYHDLSRHIQPFGSRTMASSIFKQALPSAVREIRLHFSPAQANPVKSFIQSNYSSIKSSNPDLPFLFRESSIGTPARAIVRFEYGIEKQVSLEQAKSSTEIESLLSNLIQSKN
ncbi:hypothetical protein PGT21_008858 [Puccinia graminis f. sp. tritici]|uniref:Ribosomal protein/NADH dehydrogenase domain-containing protein n=1 Tax=Puccinia graminis f. sp. tritici TaxID=56615 RepID=A0A5B0RB75_PUCGR|nr:hypothetical protein PGT21_008858 [Puccinia graminis f. sp. tritici]KAA1122986.1 hypothetical protein PGTUg99_014400 [Puccinia graminis f. sp. tritici]